MLTRRVGFRAVRRSSNGGAGRDANNTYAAGGGKRGNASAGGGFRYLAQRKSDAVQPVVLVSMTRRPSGSSAQWTPFKWKTADGGERRAPGTVPDHRPSQQLQQHQQTAVDLNAADHRPDTKAAAEGRDNPAYSSDRHDV